MLYIIWDARKQEQVTMASGKAYWPTKGAAKNALMNDIYPNHKKHFEQNELITDKVSWTHWNGIDLDIKSFANQKRFECWECVAVRLTKV